MTAFDRTLVGIAWHHAEYAVVGKLIAGLDDAALERDGLLHDVSENSSYIDEAAILHKTQVPKYLKAPPARDHEDVVNWLERLPAETTFVLYHRAQFESGFGD
jgi:hypothetical protein